MRGVVSPLIKLIAFLVVTFVFTYVLAATISNESYGDAVSYHAKFTDVTGLNEGDDVRAAGVRVGTVQSIKIVKRKGQTSIAEVGFTVQKSRSLPTSTTARLRYRNLVGQRYIDIESGGGDPNKMLAAGATIGLDHTYPAVDLTVLFQGFEPLTQGLAPATINQLSLEIIKTLQGEGGTLDVLLSRLASLTNALADKDRVIGDVIDNLTDVLTTIGNRDQQLSQLIIQLKNFVSGLASDRKTIGNALDGINDLATSTAGLLTKVRDPLKRDVVQLNGVVGNLNQNSDSTKFVLQQLAPTVAGLIRTGSYGSWFNFYLCSADVNLSLPTNVITGSPTVLKSPHTSVGSADNGRCQ